MTVWNVGLYFTFSDIYVSFHIEDLKKNIYISSANINRIQKELFKYVIIKINNESVFLFYL